MKKSKLVRTIILAGSLLSQLSTLCLHSRGAAGDLDLSFDPGSGVNGTVNAMVVQPDGKVIIGGTFTTVRGLLRTNLARLNADGSGDATFNPGVTNGMAVSSLALQSDGKVLVGGQFIDAVCDEWDCYPYYAAGVTRLNADGSLDASFSPASGGYSSYGINSIVVQSDGKVLIGGGFSSMNGTYRSGIARLNANESLDAGFNPGTGIGGYQVFVSSVAVQSDGKVLVGGYFSTFNGTNRNGIARLNPNGSLDVGFNPGAELGGENPTVESVVVQSDGKMLVAGYSFAAGNIGGVARFNSNGTLDGSFFCRTGGGVNSVAMQPDGKVLIGGNYITVNGTNRIGIARLNANGSIDTSFDPGAATTGVSAVVLQSNGQMFIGGYFTAVNGTNRNRIARLNANGGLDDAFQPGAGLEEAVTSLSIQPDGKVLTGGPFTFANGTNLVGRVRLNFNGSIDGSFVSNTNFHPDFGANSGPADYNVVKAVAVQPDGKVLVVGYTEQYDEFQGYYTDEIRFLDRLNANGGRDTNFIADSSVRGIFEPDSYYEHLIRSVAVQSDGKVLVGGQLLDSIFSGKVIRLNTNGSLDGSFNRPIGDFNPYVGVSSMVVQPDGKIIIAGTFSIINGTSRHGVARINANGSLDNSFNPGAGPGGDVLAMALQPDGKVLLGGSFTNVNGTNRNHIARLNADGGLDVTFNPGTGPNADVASVVLQPDGNVLIGGSFTEVNGVMRRYAARLYGDFGAPSTSLNIVRSNASMILSWPVPTLNFQLQESTNLALPNSWSPVPQPAVTNSAQISVTVPTSAGPKFFRLQSQ